MLKSLALHLVSSLLIRKVKQHWEWSVLGWVTRLFLLFFGKLKNMHVVCTILWAKVMYYTFMHKIRLKGKKQETNRQKMIMMIKKKSANSRFEPAKYLSSRLGVARSTNWATRVTIKLDKKHFQVIYSKYLQKRLIVPSY